MNSLWSLEGDANLGSISRQVRFEVSLVIDFYNRYVIFGMPYSEKATPNGITPLAEYSVEKLQKPIHGTNVIVTFDYWFTSIPLANKMLNKYKIITFTCTKTKLKSLRTRLLQRIDPSAVQCLCTTHTTNFSFPPIVPKRGRW